MISNGVLPDFSLPGKSAYKQVLQHTSCCIGTSGCCSVSDGHQKKYQQIISDVLSDCEGVANIADDLVVFSKDAKERDRHLFAVLDRLSEVEITEN